MTSSSLLLIRSGSVSASAAACLCRLVRLPTSAAALCTSASKPPSKPAAQPPPARPLSPANRTHVDKFLSAVDSIDKGQVYKNPEYFLFDELSYYDYEMVMESKRLPQPKSKLTAF